MGSDCISSWSLLIFLLFLVHKDIMKSVIGCRQVSSRLMTVRLKASSFNINIIQVYAPTSSRTFWLYKVIGTRKLEKMHKEIGEKFVDLTAILDFATYNNLVLANTLDNHKPSRRWTWHSPDWTHHNQIDYILVKKRFRSGIETARTRTCADVEATMTWWCWLSRKAF